MKLNFLKDFLRGGIVWRQDSRQEPVVQIVKELIRMVQNDSIPEHLMVHGKSIFTTKLVDIFRWTCCLWISAKDQYQNALQVKLTASNSWKALSEKFLESGVVNSEQRFQEGRDWGCKGCFLHIVVHFLDYKSTKIPT